MSGMQWTDVEEFEKFRNSKSTGVVLKHSTRCPISSSALREFESFREANPEVPAYLVLVVEHRPVSMAIASSTGVPHASPQALLMRDGSVVWHASHGAITRKSLADAWAAAR
jgi:bacillithiol system protein YtxJ